jgi:hypothetical protein
MPTYADVFGFTGGFEQVSAHESGCKFNPSPTSRTFLPVFNDWQASDGGGLESIHTQHTHVANLDGGLDGGQRRHVETGGSGQGDESGAGEEVHGGGGGDVLVTMREVLVLNLQDSKKRAPLTPTRERERERARERERERARRQPTVLLLIPLKPTPSYAETVKQHQPLNPKPKTLNLKP